MTDNAPGWSVTDKAAAILKSYGVDDLAAARAVVALVLDEAVKELAKWAEPGATLDHALSDEIAAIRALNPKGDA